MRPLGWLRRKLRRTPRHRHAWSYNPRTTGGWGTVRCLDCGEVDLY